MEVVEDPNVVKNTVEKSQTKLCGYYNRGYCKQKCKCLYIHAKEVCKQYIENGVCPNKSCQDRHPYLCKWTQTKDGCRRLNCEYLHDTLVRDDGYKCSGCAETWTKQTCVNRHVINNMEVFFCLNCEDWIQDKARVFDYGWTLYDDQGFLRTGI